jgi:Fe-S-cluster containining protein
LEEYKKLLRKTEEWFCSVRKKYTGSVCCRRGCSRCCYGLFDIALPDAAVIAAAFDTLAGESRSAVLRSALRIQERIKEQLVGIPRPFLLHGVSQHRIDAIVNSIADVPCPFLGRTSECLIYDQRPLACRLEGFPMADLQDGLFGDWCELNFAEGLPPESVKDFCLDYYEIQTIERKAARRLTERWLGRSLDDVTVFIPSVICHSDLFRLSAEPQRTEPRP